MADLDPLSDAESTSSKPTSDMIQPDDLKPLLRASSETVDRVHDIISPARAVLTMLKSMFNAGCFSIPYAYKMGGLWVSFGAQFVISLLNWYGSHILATSSQKLATLYQKPCLDYGHFTKKVFDLSGVPSLQARSKTMMTIVNIVILFYQLGISSVAVLYIAKILQYVTLDLFGDKHDLIFFAFLALIIVWLLNIYEDLNTVSIFTIIGVGFFLVGIAGVLLYCAKRPSQWRTLPPYTNFHSTMMFIGTAMYAYEGQTMVLPVENKLRNPRHFLWVLPITMVIGTITMSVIGFMGYTAFGEDTASTIMLNLPAHSSLYMAVNICLMLQAMFGHSIAMYVVFDMFSSGFHRKLALRFPSTRNYRGITDKLFRTFWDVITFLLAIAIPQLDILIPLIGVTSGVLCAFVFPPLFEIILFRTTWRDDYPKWKLYGKLTLNCSIISIGLFCIGAGGYANMQEILLTFTTSDPYAPPKTVNHP